MEKIHLIAKCMMIILLLNVIISVKIIQCRSFFHLTNGGILSSNDVSFYTTISDVVVDTDCCQLSWSRVVLDDENISYSIPSDAIIAGYSSNLEPIYFAKIKGRNEQAVVNFVSSTVLFHRGNVNNSLAISSVTSTIYILTNPNSCTLNWVRQSPCANLQVHRSKLYPSFKGDLFVYHNWTGDMTNLKNHYLEPDLCDPSKTSDQDHVLCIDCYESLRNHIKFELSDVIFNISSLLDEKREPITLNQVDITNIGLTDQENEVSLPAQIVLFVKIDLPNWKLPIYFPVLNVTDAEFDSSGMKDFVSLLTHGLDGNKKDYVKEKVNDLLTNGQLFISERRTINRFNQTIHFNAKSVTTQTITGTLVQGFLPLTVKFKITPKMTYSPLGALQEDKSDNPKTLWKAKKIKSFLSRSQFPDMEKVSIVDESTLLVTYEGTIRINDVIDEKLIIRSTKFSE